MLVLLESETRLRVLWQQNNGFEQHTSLMDNTLDPPQANFEIAQAAIPVGVNLSSQTSQLYCHPLSRGKQQCQDDHQIQTL